MIKLLVENPELLVDLVRRNGGIPCAEELELMPGPETARALGSERIADGSVILRRRGAGPVETAVETVVETLVVEVQLRKDAEKRKAWAVYVAGTWARVGGRVTLVVVAVSASVARWAARPIDLGHNRMVLHPLVIGPDRIPSELSLEEARAWPERLALSVLVHGHRKDSHGLARIAVRVARELLATGSHRSMVVADWLVRFLNERVRQSVEAEMKVDQDMFFTKWGKAYGKMRAEALAEGRSEGLAAGRSEGLAKGEIKGRFDGLAKALWTVLQGRGLEPTNAQRQRVERCRSDKQLEKWLSRALVASSMAEVLRR